jgi:hypothetical protein
MLIMIDRRRAGPLASGLLEAELADEAVPRLPNGEEHARQRRRAGVAVPADVEDLPSHGERELRFLPAVVGKPASDRVVRSICEAGRMARLLVVHHTASPSLQEMLESVLAGARTDEINGVEIVTRPALAATVPDVLAADAIVLGTPANIGYMSGALKHFFDTVYYPCLTDTVNLPYGLYAHGNNDTTGAVRAVEAIAKGLSWVTTRPPVCVVGQIGAADREACWDLGAVTALAALDRAPQA